jgi:hypothetical protein
MADGGWQMADGGWQKQMANGEWRIANGSWRDGVEAAVTPPSPTFSIQHPASSIYLLRRMFACES